MAHGLYLPSLMNNSAKIMVLMAISTLANAAQAADRCEHNFKPEVRFEVSPDPRAVSGANNPLLDAKLAGIAESKAFTREGIAVEGRFEPQFVGMDGNVARYRPARPGKLYAGKRYVEFPNSTAMTTVNPKTGKTREFILTRGVKPYEARINTESGEISPKGYVSDVLLFERVNGNYVFRDRILTSVEEKLFFFEDPRISVVYENGRPHYFLSGTDYSPHIKGSKDPDVMNRFVELQVDGNGLPKKVEVDPSTGKPAFMDLSPAPRMVDGQVLYVDAKNATIAQNADGQIVVRTRLRPDFKHPYVARLARGDRWDYAEQVFTFRDWSHFRSYDWGDSLVDVFGLRGREGTVSVEGPLVSKTIIRDTDLKENLRSNDRNTRIASEKPKGLGPGTRPIPLTRKGNELFGADGVGARAVSLGKIPPSLLTQFPVKDGETIFATFDHEIRYVYQTVNGKQLRRRHYSASIKIFDRTLTNMTHYLPDVIQTVTPAERGLNSGILDLLHVYPMGWVLATNSKGKQVVRVYGGASDAHTTVYDFNIIRLLSETRN